MLVELFNKKVGEDDLDTVAQQIGLDALYSNSVGDDAIDVWMEFQRVHIPAETNICMKDIKENFISFIKDYRLE